MSELLVADAEGLRRVTMNRPEKRNALTRAMYAAMAEALLQAATGPTIRAVLITGGAGMFHRRQRYGRLRARGETPVEEPSPARGFLAALSECPKPVVAAVAGAAVASAPRCCSIVIWSMRPRARVSHCLLW